MHFLWWHEVLKGFSVSCLVVFESEFFRGLGGIYKVKQKEYQENGIDSTMQLQKKTRFFGSEVFRVWKNAPQYLELQYLK